MVTAVAMDEIAKKFMGSGMEDFFKSLVAEAVEAAIKETSSDKKAEETVEKQEAESPIKPKKGKRGKRRNGEGGFIIRADGRHMLRVMIGRQDNGKPKYKCFYGRTDAECLAKHDEYKAKKRAGLDLSKHYKFSEFADIWFEQHKSEIEPSTQEGYAYTLRTLKDKFGQEYIEDIKADAVTKFLKEYREVYSDSSRAKCRALLFQIFRYAVANDLLLKNPVEHVEKLRSKDKGSKPKKKDAFTEEEVLKILETIPRDSRYAHGMILMLGTGMRGQELLALQPLHISEDGKELMVEQAIKRVKGRVYVGGPKSQKSYRCVPVAEFAQESARILRSTEKPFLFEGRIKGKPCCPETFRDYFAKYIDLAGVRKLTPHCCRHTYVSLMQAIGVDMETIMDIVGHEDIDMTRHYLHVQKSIRENAAERLSTRFRDAVSKTV
jgi:integrase